ncbi:hypothetical protein FB451DRAFT_250512 [Mycena latifolia]|nr:hypothetical protein FB451DRAFT_250512 [Mycena latifolia]
MGFGLPFPPRCISWFRFILRTTQLIHHFLTASMPPRRRPNAEPEPQQPEVIQSEPFVPPSKWIKQSSPKLQNANRAPEDHPRVRTRHHLRRNLPRAGAGGASLKHRPNLMLPPPPTCLRLRLVPQKTTGKLPNHAPRMSSTMALPLHLVLGKMVLRPPLVLGNVRTCISTTRNLANTFLRRLCHPATTNHPLHRIVGIADHHGLALIMHPCPDLGKQVADQAQPETCGLSSREKRLESA